MTVPVFDFNVSEFEILRLLKGRGVPLSIPEIEYTFYSRNLFFLVPQVKIACKQLVEKGRCKFNEKGEIEVIQ